MNLTRALLRTLIVAAPLAAVAAPAAFASTATTAPPGAMAEYTPKPALPFIADDYTKAVAEARARKVPLFIEAWAPW